MLHDLGTVRIFEIGGQLEVFFAKGDSLSMAVTKQLQGRWDPNRRAWRIDPRWARSDIRSIIAHFRTQHLEASPEKWRSRVSVLSQIVSTTKKFGIYIGEAGTRLELPRGHKHEWTLKSNVKGAILDGQMWLLPSGICPDIEARQVINDVIKDDRTALTTCLDYMGGFTLTGELNLAEGEELQIGLEIGNTVFADPSFVRKADAGIPAEPMKLYPMRVVDVGPSPSGGSTGKFAFITGDEAYQALRQRLNPHEAKGMVLDVRHVTGKWVRKRG